MRPMKLSPKQKKTSCRILGNKKPRHSTDQSPRDELEQLLDSSFL